MTLDLLERTVHVHACLRKMLSLTLSGWWCRAPRSGPAKGAEEMVLGAYERWCGVDDAMMTWLMVPEVMEALQRRRRSPLSKAECRPIKVSSVMECRK